MTKIETIHDRMRHIVATLAGGRNTVLAQKIGVSEANIRGYVKNVVPKADVLGKIVSTCDINGDWLLTGEGEMMRIDANNGNVQQNINSSNITQTGNVETANLDKLVSVISEQSQHIDRLITLLEKKEQ